MCMATRLMSDRDEMHVVSSSTTRLLLICMFSFVQTCLLPHDCIYRFLGGSDGHICMQLQCTRIPGDPGVFE